MEGKVHVGWMVGENTTCLNTVQAGLHYLCACVLTSLPQIAYMYYVKQAALPLLIKHCIHVL